MEEFPTFTLMVTGFAVGKYKNAYISAVSPNLKDNKFTCRVKNEEPACAVTRHAKHEGSERLQKTIKLCT
jgi:hypothetical protein